MIQIPSKRQSWASIILGIVMILGSIMILAQGMGYNSGNTPSMFLYGFFNLLLGFILIDLGSRKVIDPDQFLIFLRNIIRGEVARKSNK